MLVVDMVVDTFSTTMNRPRQRSWSTIPVHVSADLKRADDRSLRYARPSPERAPLAGRCGARRESVRRTYRVARLQTLEGGAPGSVFTVAKEMGHGGEAMVYGHLRRFAAERPRWSTGSTSTRLSWRIIWQP